MSTRRCSQHDVDTAILATRRRQRDLRITTSTPRPSQHDVDTATLAARRRHRDLRSTTSTPRPSQHDVDTAMLAARYRHGDSRSTLSTQRRSQHDLDTAAFAARCRHREVARSRHREPSRDDVEAPRRPPQARSEFQTQAASLTTLESERCRRGRSLCLSGGLRRVAGRRYWPPLGPRTTRSSALPDDRRTGWEVCTTTPVGRALPPTARSKPRPSERAFVVQTRSGSGSAADPRSAAPRRFRALRTTMSHPRGPPHGVASARAARRCRICEVCLTVLYPQGPPHGAASARPAPRCRICGIRDVPSTISCPRAPQRDVARCRHREVLRPRATLT